MGGACTRATIILFLPFLGVLSLFKIIIVGYSYVTCLGWVFSRFFIHEQGSCCTAAAD